MAKQRIVSDYIVWDAHVTSRAATAPAASKQLATWTARVRAFFTKEGVQAAELTATPVSAVAPGDTDDSGNEISNYQLTRSFQLRSNRIDATDYGTYDTSTLRTDVTAVVNVTFALS